MTTRTHTHTHTRNGNRPRSRALLVGSAVLALVVVLVALGVSRGGDDPAGVRFVPIPPPAGPAEDLTWWAPVHGEPLGVAVDGPDVAAAALDEVRLLGADGGRERWVAPVPGVRRYRPALGGDRVAATSEAELVLLDRADGARVAAVPFAGPGPAAVLTRVDQGLDTQLVAAGSETGALVVVEAHDGAPRWSTAFAGAVTVAPQVAGTTLLAVWHDGAGAVLRAFDAASGTPRWETTLGTVAGPPVVTGGGVMVVAGDGIHSASVRLLDPATGGEWWRTPLPGWWDDELEAGHDPVVDPGTVYLLDGMGTVVAVDVASGAVRWRQETGRTLVDGRIGVTPGSVVFASYDDDLVVLDRADGRVRAAEPQRGVPVDLAPAGDRLVVALRLGAPSRVEARPAP